MMRTSSGNEVTINDVVRFLDRLLGTAKIKDASVNGLQVKSKNRSGIANIGFAVDADLATIALAKLVGVELLVVHHGIAWRPQKSRDLEQKRSGLLKKNNMALYAAHLPLDLHGEYGNNIQLSRLLGLTRIRKFGLYHGVRIGYAGVLGTAVPLKSIAEALDRGLDTQCRVMRFGRERVRSVGIISGGGGSMLQEAVAEKLDCFIVGEMDLAVYNAARDQGMNLIAAGHYASETLGIKALMPAIREAFNVRTIFVDEPKDW